MLWWEQLTFSYVSRQNVTKVYMIISSLLCCHESVSDHYRWFTLLPPVCIQGLTVVHKTTLWITCLLSMHSRKLTYWLYTGPSYNWCVKKINCPFQKLLQVNFSLQNILFYYTSICLTTIFWFRDCSISGAKFGCNFFPADKNFQGPKFLWHVVRC